MLLNRTDLADISPELSRLLDTSEIAVETPSSAARSCRLGLATGLGHLALERA